MSDAFTDYALIVSRPVSVWQQCQEQDCGNQASWTRYQGYLAEETPLCTKHKKEFEQDEESEQEV